MTDAPTETDPADSTDSTDSAAVVTSTAASTAATHRPLVVLEKVNKHFGELHVLKDIDLTIGEGEVVVVIGPSGSGKSTLCRAINRLETVESGTITIDGVPLPDEGKELGAALLIARGNGSAYGLVCRVLGLQTVECELI